MKRIEIAGQKFNRLLVIEPAYQWPNGEWRWLCRCDCGNDAIVNGSHIRSGYIKSCGCLRKDTAPSLRHGEARPGRKSVEYLTWYGIRQRCMNSHAPDYARYGGRGIVVCERWQTFENFLADMGRRPSREHSIDRIDNNKGYAPENCRWATNREQQRNTSRTRRITFRGVTKCLTEWATELGISSGAVSDRIARGWPLEIALTQRSVRGR